jgi:hypothetical protein
MSDNDNDDIQYTEEEVRAFAAGQIRIAGEAIDRHVWALAGHKARIWAQGQSFVGTMLSYDGKRAVLEHDTNTCTIIWLESGVVLSAVKE